MSGVGSVQPLGMEEIDLQEDLQQPAPSKPIIKLLHARDVVSERANELLTSITKADLEVRKIKDAQKEISEKLSKHQFTVVEQRSQLTSTELDAWVSTLKSNETRIAAQREAVISLYAKMPFVSEEGLCEEVLENLKALQHALSILNSDCKKLLAICESDWFAKTANWYLKQRQELLKIEKMGSCTEKLDALTTLCEALQKRLQALTPQNYTKLSKVLQRRIRTLYMHGSFFLFRTIYDLKRNIQTRAIPLASNENFAVLVGKLAQLQKKFIGFPRKLIADLDAVEKEPPQRDASDRVRLEIQILFGLPPLDAEIETLYGGDFPEPREPPPIPARMIELELQALGKGITLRGNFFIPETDSWKPTTMAFYYWNKKYYAEAKSVSGAMKALAQHTLGVLEKLEDFHKKDTPDHWKQLYARLKVVLSQLRMEMLTITQTDLHPDIDNYLSMVAAKVETAGDLLRRRLAFESEGHQEVRDLERKVFQLLASPDPALPKTVQLQQKGEKLYQVAKGVTTRYGDLLADCRAKKPAATDEELLRDIEKAILTKDGFTRQLIVTLKETLAEKGPAIVSLSDDEKKVFHTLVVKGNLTSLRDPREEESELLPACVKAYIEKRIGDLIYISKKSYDLLLEMVFYRLQTHARYKKLWEDALEKDAVLKEIYQDYVARCREAPQKLSNDQMEFAIRILKWCEKAKESTDRFLHAKASQHVIDLCAGFSPDLAKEPIAQELIVTLTDALKTCPDFIQIPLTRVGESPRRRQSGSSENTLGFSISSEIGVQVKNIDSFNLNKDLLLEMYKDSLSYVFWRALICHRFGAKEEEQKMAISIMKDISESHKIDAEIRGYQKDFGLLFPVK